MPKYDNPEKADAIIGLFLQLSNKDQAILKGQLIALENNEGKKEITTEL